MAKQSKKQPTSAPSISIPSEVSRIVGLDISLTGTGYCYWDKDLPENMQPVMGTVDTDKMTGLERMDYILEEVKKLERKSCNNVFVIEDFSFASKGSGLFQIAGMGFIIRHYLYKHKIPYVLVPPTVLKKYVTGVGNADKSVMLKEVYKRWGADINDDNIADAYGLARIGRALASWDVAADLVAYQKEALKQLNK